MSAGLHLGLRRGDLVERAAEVHGRGAGAVGVGPRDRAVERPVELEHPGAVAVAGERPAIPVGNGVTGNREHLAWREVEQHRIGRREFGERRDPPVALDPTTEALQDGHERVGDLLRSTLRERPPDEMGEHAEHQAVARRHGRLQAQDRVAGEPGEQRPRLVGVEPPASDRVGRQDADRAVAGERDRVLRRDRERRQQPVGQVETGLDERAEQPTVRLGVGARGRRRCRRPNGAGRAARPPSSGCATGTSEWIHSRPCASSGVSLAAISRNAGEPTASGWIAEHTSCSTPGSVSSSVRVPPPGRDGGLEHRHVPAGSRQRDGRHQPVRTGADDHGRPAALGRHLTHCATPSQVGGADRP